MDYSNNPVRIESLYSPDPAKQENYSIICDDHRVRTVVTAKPAVVRRWVNQIRHRHRHLLYRGRLVVGLGVQWAPGRSASGPPATLQLCVGHHCLIFQLLYADQSPAVLHRFLSDPDVTFVGVWNYKDARMLRDSYHRLEVPRLVDVRDLACDVWGSGRRVSTERLAAAVLGMDGVKKKGWVGRSDWEQEWLSEEQVEYACVDAFLAFMIAVELEVWDWDDQD